MFSCLVEGLCTSMNLDAAALATHWNAFKPMNPDLEEMLKERLSEAYPVFIDLSQAILHCLNKVVGRLEELNSKNAFRNQLRLISSRREIKNLLKKIDGYIDALVAILRHGSQLRYDKPNIRSSQIKPLLSNAKRIEKNADIIFTTLRQAALEAQLGKKAFIEGFRISNQMQSYRHFRILLSPRDLPPSSATDPRANRLLDICIECDEKLEDPPESPLYQPVSGLNLLTGPEVELTEPAKIPKLKVHFETPVHSHLEEQYHGQPNKAVSLKRLGHLLREPETLLKLNPTPLRDSAMVRIEADMFSLRDVLRLAVRSSRANRLHLAVSLTWDVICLMNTPWVGDGLKAVDIFFARDGGNVHLGVPLICQSFDRGDYWQEDLVSRIDKQVFRLGVILFELSLGRNIEDLEQGQQLGRLPEHLSESILISRMIDV
ncbi:MAG: hypothetical protein Q9214_005800, partial [Letrouitia sp. 1 TL-2023]